MVVRVWQVNPFREVASFEGHTAEIRALAWSPDGRTLASGGPDGTVRLWDVAGRKPLHVLQGNLKKVHALAWSPDSQQLVAHGDLPLLQVWSAESWKALPCLAVFATTGHEERRRLIWSRDAQTLACASDTGSRLFDTKSWELLREVPGNGFSPDLSRYFTLDGYRLCGTSTGRSVGSLVPLRGGKGFAVTPDGQFRGNPVVEKEIVYVVQTDHGQETLTAEQFRQRFPR